MERLVENESHKGSDGALVRATTYQRRNRLVVDTRTAANDKQTRTQATRLLYVTTRQ